MRQQAWDYKHEAEFLRGELEDMADTYHDDPHWYMEKAQKTLEASK